MAKALRPLPPPTPTAAAPVWFELLVTYLAGCKHHTTPMALSALPHGAELTLTREPTNAHDTNAIMCVRSDITPAQKVGHIPAVQAQWLAALLDNGYEIRAIVEHVEPTKMAVAVMLEMPRQ